MESNESRQLGAIARRPRWTAEEAEAVLGAAARSGLSLEEFAQQYGIGAAKLYRWKRRLQPEVYTEEPVYFEEVHVQRATDGARREDERVEVVTPSGYVVRLGPSFDEVVLRRLLFVLGDMVGPC